LRSTVAGEKHIPRSDVTVHHSPAMQMVQCIGQRNQECCHLTGVESPPSGDQRCQAATRGQVQNHGEPTGWQWDDPLQPDDMRVINPAQHRRLVFRSPIRRIT
jgi:hypothetical protein